jgi:uncharacterized membrane protein
MPTSALAVAAKSVLPQESVAHRAVAELPEVPRNLGQTEQLISVVVGGCMAVSGLSSRTIDPIRLLAGGYLLYRGLSGNCPIVRAVSSMTQGDRTTTVIPARSGVRFEHSITVDKPVEELYRTWRDLAQLPRYMSHLVEVREQDRSRSHWVAQGPLGVRIEWDAEISKDSPNEVIAWRSLPNSDVDTAGSVHFRRLKDGKSTEVRVNLKYDPPAGAAGAAIARLFGQDPRRQIQGDMARFKQTMEAGSSTKAPTIGERR